MNRRLQGLIVVAAVGLALTAGCGRQPVHVSHARTLGTANGPVEGGWDWAENFEQPQQEINLVVGMLPASVGETQARLTILPPHGKGPVWDESFAWYSSDLWTSYKVQRRELVDQFGQGRYTAILYANGKKVACRGFNVR